MDSTTSPPVLVGEPDGGDKPRILVDGPGGADTKQGAKIACLECRSAKIKCSAPTDGQVPCKRCVKHQRECLFEKHKRGRKPNKRFSVPSDLRNAGRHSDENGNSFSPQSTRRPSSTGDPNDHIQHHQHAHSHQHQQSHAHQHPHLPSHPPSHAHPPHLQQQQQHTPSSAHHLSRNGKQDNVFATDRTHFNDGHWNSNPSGYGGPGAPRSAHSTYADGDRYHTPLQKFGSGPGSGSSAGSGSSGSGGGLPVSMSAPSGLSGAAHGYSYHSGSAQTHAPTHHSHQQQPSSYAGTNAGSGNSSNNLRHPADAPSPGRWRDPPGPPLGSSPHSSHSASKAFGSGKSSSQHDTYAHGRSRPYPQGSGPVHNHSYAQWDSQLGSERAAKSRIDLSPSRRPEGQPSNQHQRQQQSQSSSQPPRYSHTDGASQKMSTVMATGEENVRSSPKGRTPRTASSALPHQRSSSRNGGYDHDADEEFEDEQDELEDDADATREEHDNVLSNPLKLLAQASDAAAAKIEGRRIEPSSRGSLAAVETMGLLQPAALPSTRMAVSAAVNLTGLGRPFYGQRPEESRSHPRGWASSRVLPPLLQSANRSGHSAAPMPDLTNRSQPSFLKDSMRSKSFPAGELPRGDGTGSVADEADSSAASANTPGVGSGVTVSKSGTISSLGRPNVLTPSTLDHEAWEYREGKAQARRGYGSGASPGNFSADAATTTSSTSAGALAGGQKAMGVSGMNGGSPGEIIESPADEVTTAMLGKRKRGRSRIARGGTLPVRRRKMSEWDTDAENVEGGEDDQLAEPAKAKQVSIAIAPAGAAKDAGGITSGGEGEAGASRKGYFNLSLFHSKNDDHEGLDPVELGLVELKDLERLFDIFFARINPVLDLFDPFLHSVAFVRMRSAFLTTVISGMAARFSDTVQDAQIASVLDKHWQEKLLPMILLNGYKSVEISQAFLILTTYSRPTNRLVDDRSWQYLGFAIRTATEVGVNRKVTPSENLLGNEQVARRVRNRERLWYNLFLYDRTLSAQTGRPWTITEDRMIVQSSMWHRQDFALPEDVSLVSLIKLRRITAQHTEAFDTYLSSPDRFDEAQAATALGVGGQSQFDRRLAGLEFFRKNANADLEKWKETWCINTEEKIKEVDTSTAAGKYLVRWAPTAKLFYYHSRLLINSLVLGATEQYQDFISGSSVSVDCWTSAISLIDTVLNDFAEEAVVTWSNDRVVMAVYAAVSAVRMTNLSHKYAFADKETLLALVRRLAVSMTKAGKTPRHRNGSATPYGRYLKSVLAAFEPDSSKMLNQEGESGSADASATVVGLSGVAQAQTPGKDSEQATSLSTSSLAPGDSRSAANTPAAANVSTTVVVDASAIVDGSKDMLAVAGLTQSGEVQAAINSEDKDVEMAEVDATTKDGPAIGASGAREEGSDRNLSHVNGNREANERQVAAMVSTSESSVIPLKPEDVVSQISAGKTLDMPLIMTENGLGLDAQAASDLAAAGALALGSDAGKLIPRVDVIDPTTAAAAAAAAAAATGSSVTWPTPELSVRPISSSSSAAASASNGLLSTPDSSLMLANTLVGPGSEAVVQSNSVSGSGTGSSLSIASTNAPTVNTSGAPAASAATAQDASMAAAAAAAAATMPNVVDDPESLERMWDYMTAFEHTTFWQPQSAWNLSSSGQTHQHHGGS